LTRKTGIMGLVHVEKSDALLRLTVLTRITSVTTRWTELP